MLPGEAHFSECSQQRAFKKRMRSLNGKSEFKSENREKESELQFTINFYSLSDTDKQPMAIRAGEM